MDEKRERRWIPGEKADYVKELVEIINQEERDDQLAEKLSAYHENDIAEAFELLDEKGRRKLYRVLDTEWMSEVFAYLDDVGTYLEELEADDAADIIENMDADDAVDVLQEVDDNVREKLVSLMNEEATEDIELICSYQEDQIGSMMTTNFIEISRTLTIKQAMRQLIAQADDNDNISILYVTDEDGMFYGAIDLKDLIIARAGESLESLISTSYPYVLASDSITDNLERLKDYAEDSIPVLDQEHHIIGVITAQDLVEAVDDEMGEDYAQLAGLTTEEDLDESVGQSMKKRLPWLLVLLCLGLGGSGDVREGHETADPHRLFPVGGLGDVRQLRHPIPGCHHPCADGRGIDRQGTSQDGLEGSPCGLLRWPAVGAGVLCVHRHLHHAGQGQTGSVRLLRLRLRGHSADGGHDHLQPGGHRGAHRPAQDPHRPCRSLRPSHQHGQ